MKFRKIELRNFRQFYGDQNIVFSTDVNKNITLIHAENGTGKTALLNAILWCFFEIHTPNFKLPTILLNKAAQREGKTNYSVAVEFEDDKGNVFLIKRSNHIGRTFQVYESQENTYKEITKPNSFIN